MKVPFQQKLPWGCGHFAIANLFNDERFLNDIEKDKASFLVDLNSSLNRYLPGYWLTTIFCTPPGMKLQNRLVDTSLFDFDYIDDTILNSFKAYIVTVKYQFEGHIFLACHNVKDDFFYIFDSHNELAKCMTKEEFLLSYHVCEVAQFENTEVKESCSSGKARVTLFFNYEFLSHLKP